MARPVVLDHVFTDVKIVHIVDSMSFAVVFRKVRVGVLRLVLEFCVKMIKVAHQANIVLDCITKCVPEGVLRKRVTKMTIALLVSTVVTTGNAQLGQATQTSEVKVKLVGDL